MMKEKTDSMEGRVGPKVLLRTTGCFTAPCFSCSPVERSLLLGLLYTSSASFISVLLLFYLYIYIYIYAQRGLCSHVCFTASLTYKHAGTSHQLRLFLQTYMCRLMRGERVERGSDMWS